ncbi:hypothetical protein EVA_13095 [gut metagenome]|uniref:Uncharacterized protein n=1 Tax=gut metagenome TaxID=749906 RepID=J9FW96_9ZZZZ
MSRQGRHNSSSKSSVRTEGFNISQNSGSARRIDTGNT